MLMLQRRPSDPTWGPVRSRRPAMATYTVTAATTAEPALPLPTRQQETPLPMEALRGWWFGPGHPQTHDK